MYDLHNFGLTEAMLVCGALRQVGKGADSLETASQRVARFFVDEFSDPGTGRPTMVLSRVYKTHQLDRLPTDLVGFARGVFPDQDIAPQTQCLTLMGTYGDEPVWQRRQDSRGHQTIPLATEQIIDKLPMVARLTQSLGLSPSEVVRPDSTLLLEKDRAGFNVFHVEEALGSAYIPAQDEFVKPFGVRSVVGFGFVAPPADVYAVVLFSRQRITSEVAELFKTMSLSLKLAILPLAARPAFRTVTG